MTDKPEVNKLSEWQDILGVLQRIAEAEAFCSNMLMAMQGYDGQQYIENFIFGVDSFFRPFKWICTADEQKEFEERKKKAIDLMKKTVIKVKNFQAANGRKPYKMPTDDLNVFADFLDYAYKLRQDKGLGIRVSVLKKWKELGKNVIGEG